MAQKLPEETVNATSKVGVGIFILLFLVGIALGSTLIPGVKDSLENLFGWGPGTDERLKVSENFNSTLDNINNCDNNSDEDCICEIWPDFPIVFPKDYVLTSDGHRLVLSRGTRKVSSGDLAPELGIYPVSNYLKGLSNEKIKYNYVFLGKPFLLGQDLQEITITFNSKYPKIEKVSYGTIISRYALKDDSGSLFILAAFYNDIAEQEVSEINTKINTLPKCIEGRQEAIEEFRRILASVTSSTGDYTLKFPDGFSIDFKDSSASLNYNKEIVKEIKYFPIPNTESKRFETEDINGTVKLCSDSRKEGSLKKGYVITIKQENTGSGTSGCLFFN